MTDKLYLAIDQGGHASRAMVFNASGYIIAQASCPLDAYSAHPAWVEYAADELVAATRMTINEVIKQLASQANKICCAGLITQRSNIVCWNRKSGEPLTAIISWQDLRNAQWIE